MIMVHLFAKLPFSEEKHLFTGGFGRIPDTGTK